MASPLHPDGWEQSYHSCGGGERFDVAPSSVFVSASGRELPWAASQRTKVDHPAPNSYRSDSPTGRRNVSASKSAFDSMTDVG